MKLPSGWQLARIHDLGLVEGGRQRAPHLVAGQLRPYLRVANVLDGYIDSSNVLEMNFTDSEFERFKLRRGDILLNEGQSLELVGRSAVYEGIPANCCFQNTLIRFRPHKETDGKFAFQLFNYLMEIGCFSRIAVKTTSIAHLGVNRFGSLEVKVPPPQEQARIGEFLEVSDLILRRQTQRISLSMQRKRGLMQHLLTGKIRFREFEGEPWRNVRLGELLREVNRYVEFDDEHIYKLASVRRRSEGLFFREELRGSDIKTKVMKTIRTGDFLISKMQVVHGAWGLVTPQFNGMFVSDSYIALVPRDASVLNIEFFKYLSQTRYLRHLAYLACHGVHIEKMTFHVEDFLQATIKIPTSLEEQAKIVSVLAACDSEVELLQKQLKALKEQKRGLMQKLLTGQIRVKLPA